MSKQRSLYVQKEILPKRQKKLEKIGFVFQPSHAKGIPRKKHGHTVDVRSDAQKEGEDEKEEEDGDDEEEEETEQDDDDGEYINEDEHNVNKSDYGGEKFWENMFTKLMAYKKQQ